MKTRLTEKEKGKRFLQAAEAANPTWKRAEFRCPICRGVASAQMSCGQLYAECHCFGIHVKRMA